MKSTLLALSVALALGLSMTAYAEDAVTVKIGQSSPLTGPKHTSVKITTTACAWRLTKSTRLSPPLMAK